MMDSGDTVIKITSTPGHWATEMFDLIFHLWKFAEQIWTWPAHFTVLKTVLSTSQFLLKVKNLYLNLSKDYEGVLLLAVL